MNHIIATDPDGGTAVLTTDSPASHYGVPVLRIGAADVEGDFGPADLIGDIDRPETLATAACIVAGWAMNAARSVGTYDVMTSSSCAGSTIPASALPRA